MSAMGFQRRNQRLPDAPAAIALADHQHLDKAAAEEVIVQHTVAHHHAPFFGKIADTLCAPGADLRRALRLVFGDAVEGDQGCGIGFSGKTNKHVYPFILMGDGDTASTKRQPKRDNFYIPAEFCNPIIELLKHTPRKESFSR